jgi:ribosomal protein L16/L10AE
MKQQVMKNKRTDEEIIPYAAELRKVLRETRFREGKLVVKDLAAYVESVKRIIPIYQDMIGRKHYKETVKYAAFKLELITEVLRDNYGIELSEKK